MRATAALLGGGLALSGLAGCGGGPGVAAGRAGGVVPAPLPAAVEAAGATWATVAVPAEPPDPNRGYWQLLSRPRGSGRWTNDVAATATATNGGLVLAASASRFEAAVIPSGNLTFSPLIQTGDDGIHWSAGPMPGPVTAGAFSLAVGPGATAALLDQPGPEQRLAIRPAGPAAAWTTIAVGRRVETAVNGCSPSLTAVAFVGRRLFAAGSCAGRTTGPLLVEVDLNGAARSGPGSAGLRVGTTVAVPAPPAAGGDSTVMALTARPGGGLDALVQGRAGLVMAWTGAPDRGRWAANARLAAAPGRLVSVVSRAGGYLALVAGAPKGTAGAPAGDAVALWAASESSAGWTRLPDPPPGTATVAPLQPSGLSALIPRHGGVAYSDLVAGGWQRERFLAVPILYGATG